MKLKCSKILFLCEVGNDFRCIEKTNKKYREYVQDAYDKVIEHCYERVEKTKVGTIHISLSVVGSFFIAAPGASWVPCFVFFGGGARAVFFRQTQLEKIFPDKNVLIYPPPPSTNFLVKKSKMNTGDFRPSRCLTFHVRCHSFSYELEYHNAHALLLYNRSHRNP